MAELDYEKLLKKARKELPVKSTETARFEIPKVVGHLQGNRTVVSNFMQIAQHFGIDPKHMLKYILKELATPGEFKKSGVVIFGTKLSASRINEKIQQYADVFVICKECGKPDTKLEKEGDIYFIKCQACGAKHSVYSKT